MKTLAVTCAVLISTLALAGCESKPDDNVSTVDSTVQPKSEAEAQAEAQDLLDNTVGKTP